MLGAFGDDGGRMHGMEENEVRGSGVLWGGSTRSSGGSSRNSD